MYKFVPPRLFLLKEEATFEALYNYLLGFAALTKLGENERRRFASTLRIAIWVQRKSGAFVLDLLFKEMGKRLTYTVNRSRVEVLDHKDEFRFSIDERSPRGLLEDEVWFITAHLSAVLIACYLQKQKAQGKAERRSSRAN